MPSFPLPVLIAAVALALGALAGRWVARRTVGAQADATVSVGSSGAAEGGRKSPSLLSILLDLVFAGVVAARLAFVAQWWDAYREDAWSILRLGDGGFTWWAALPAVLAVGAWAWHRRPGLRQALVVAVAVAALAFALMMGARHVLTAPGAPLPDVTLRALDGTEVPLRSFTGKPVVLNLWATWCGPCRREMPALVRAQSRHAQVHFVFANQGESRAEVESYLRQSGLAPGNALLDTGTQLSTALTARALPTTAFYDAQGRQVRVHVGELTGAAIEEQLQAMGALAPTAAQAGSGPTPR